MSAAAHLDGMSEAEALAALTRCCGARRWVAGMLQRRPFTTDEALMAAADATWAAAGPDDVREALLHHPEIGADIDELRRKFQSTAQWSQGEQAGVGSASETVLQALRAGNVAYKQKFGHIFVVCASGKTAAQMLALLQARLPNDAELELSIAAAEQGKITKLRLAKLAPEQRLPESR